MLQVPNLLINFDTMRNCEPGYTGNDLEVQLKKKHPAHCSVEPNLLFRCVVDMCSPAWSAVGEALSVR